MALVTGTIVGILFTLLKLPIPAPPQLAGVAGIIGIFLGYHGAQFVAEVLV